MSYYPDKWTDMELEKLEKKIKKEYGKAWKELEKKAEEYFKQFEKRYKQEFEAYQNGKYTKQEFDLWVQSQLGRGARWEDLRDMMSGRVTDANKVAASYINDVTPGIYSLNHNFEAHVISTVHKNAAFNLVDEQTIKRLLMRKVPVLPFNKAVINIPKDERWNQQKIQNALTQGILQGDGIDQIAKRFMSVTDMNQRSAVTNARTAFTSAQNGGRYAAYQQADQMGITVKKTWVATKDGRTRTSHRDLDGETVPFYMAFSNGLMYPGDMSAYKPEEVYNCRCTVRNSDVALDNSTRKMVVKTETGEWVEVNYMTYREWEKWQKSQ